MLSNFNSISFTVYGNPVPAQRARVMRGGWSFTPKRTIEAEEAVAAAWRAAAQGRWFPIGALDMTVGFYLGDRRRKDVDNLLKTVLDGLTKGSAWSDDSQVRLLTAAVHMDREHPRTVVSVEGYGSATWGDGLLAMLPESPLPRKRKRK